MSLMKGQGKTPGKQLKCRGDRQPSRKRIQNNDSEDDPGSWKKKWREEIEKMQEMFTKDLQELKNKHTELNSTLEGINNRVTEAEEWTNDLEERMLEITGAEQNIEKRMKRNEDSLRELWDSIKHTTSLALQESQKEKRERA